MVPLLQEWWQGIAKHSATTASMVAKDSTAQCKCSKQGIAQHSALLQARDSTVQAMAKNRTQRRQLKEKTALGKSLHLDYTYRTPQLFGAMLKMIVAREVF